MSGPPCIPGNTLPSRAFWYSFLHRIMPPRGPRSVLWVVVVTNSHSGTGLGWTPAATSPAMWAMSKSTTAPTWSAIWRKGSEGISRE